MSVAGSGSPSTQRTQGTQATQRARHSPLARVLLLALRGYRRWISPALPPTCRFHPTCSTYAVEAIRTHGALRGAGLAAWRLLKCAPWHPGGIDPVPPRRAHRAHWPRRAEARSITRSIPDHEEQAPC